MPSIYSFIIIIMLLIGVFPIFGMDIEILAYTVFSLVILNDLNECSYTMVSMLPIRIRDRLKIIYLHMFSIYILGYIASFIGYIIIGRSRPFTTSIVIILLSSIISNIFYSKFCSIECKEDIIDLLKESTRFQIVIIILCICIFLIYFTEMKDGVIDYIFQQMGRPLQFTVISVLGIGVVISTHKSLQTLERIIKGDNDLSK